MARKKTVTTTIDEADGDEVLETSDVPVAVETLADGEDRDAMEYLLSLGGEEGMRYRVDRMPSRDRPGDRIAFCNNYTRESLNLGRPGGRSAGTGQARRGVGHARQPTARRLPVPNPSAFEGEEIGHRRRI